MFPLDEHVLFFNVLQDSIDVAQHKTMEDRLKAARILKSNNGPIPILVDTMDNEALTAYAPMPERLFILLDEEVSYEGGRGPMDYNLDEVRDWLTKWRGRHIS